MQEKISKKSQTSPLGKKRSAKKTLTPPHSEVQKPMPLMRPFVHEKKSIGNPLSNTG